MSTPLQNCPCVICPEKPFIFKNPETQRTANTVYEAQAAHNAVNPVKLYRFKNDMERMQALIGRHGRVCNNKAVQPNNLVQPLIPMR